MNDGSWPSVLNCFFFCRDWQSRNSGSLCSKAMGLSWAWTPKKWKVFIHHLRRMDSLGKMVLHITSQVYLEFLHPWVFITLSLCTLKKERDAKNILTRTEYVMGGLQYWRELRLRGEERKINWFKFYESTFSHRTACRWPHCLHPPPPVFS